MADTLGKLVEYKPGLIDSWVFEFGDDGRSVMVLYDFQFVSVYMTYPWRASRTLWHASHFKDDVKMIRWPDPVGVAKQAIERVKLLRKEKAA